MSSPVESFSHHPAQPELLMPQAQLSRTAEKLAQRFEDGEVVTCAPVVLEAMHRARSGEHYEQLMTELFDPLGWLPLGLDQSVRATDVQRQMAATTDGNHLRPAIDYLIAAIAEAGEETVLWSFDRDLEIICDHTQQPQEAEGSTGTGS